MRRSLVTPLAAGRIRWPVRDQTGEEGRTRCGGGANRPGSLSHGIRPILALEQCRPARLGAYESVKAEGQHLEFLGVLSEPVSERCRSSGPVVTWSIALYEANTIGLFRSRTRPGSRLNSSRARRRSTTPAHRTGRRRPMRTGQRRSPRLLTELSTQRRSIQRGP